MHAAKKKLYLLYIYYRLKKGNVHKMFGMHRNVCMTEVGSFNAKGKVNI